MSRPRIVLIGLGGLGCPAALSLLEEAHARKLAFELLLVDGDRVDRSNLARQTLYAASDIGELKAKAAAAALLRLVPDAPVELLPHAAQFDESTAQAFLNARDSGCDALDNRCDVLDSRCDVLDAGCDVLIDATDSFATRFLANDRAVSARIPLVHGAALGWSGQLMTIHPDGPCLRCLFEGPPPPGSVPACAEAGVLGPLCAVVGAAMAAEAIAILLAGPLHAKGALIHWDALSGRARAIAVPKDPACPCCGARVVDEGATGKLLAPSIENANSIESAKLPMATPDAVGHQS